MKPGVLSLHSIVRLGTAVSLRSVDYEDSGFVSGLGAGKGGGHQAGEASDSVG